MTALTITAPNFTKTHPCDLHPKDRLKIEFNWKMEEAHGFDELILSWNGLRPKKGKWTFWVSILEKGWSPWIRYAEYGQNLQKTFQHSVIGSPIESYQDAVYSKNGKCYAFRIKAAARDGANLENLYSLYACLSNLSDYKPPLSKNHLPSISLPNFPGVSQLKLKHPRAKDLCSPTATSSVISYLLKKKTCPIKFAHKIRDMEFDIYGNWILNTAEAFQELSPLFRCYVQRFSSFAEIHPLLMEGLPVIVSVRGPLPGSYLPLTFGHLITIIGYDEKKKEVLCMDSAFPDDEKTHVSYPLQEFLSAWARRQNIAYVFKPYSCGGIS